MRSFDQCRALFDDELAQWCAELPEGALYAPMRYLLGLPAKRVRPAMVMMACELFGGRPEDAIDEALGIELFHNFTLMHDDIMDAAPLRRGQPSVHARWDINRAILSGDALLVKAYERMSRNSEVRELFSRTALLVCEGQQLDMDLENNEQAGPSQYLEMIRCKTGALLRGALECGALVAGAPPDDRERIGTFGERLGLAFQLRDDLLDAFGGSAATGKLAGGDLRAGKRTLLLVRALEQDRGVLRHELSRPPDQRDVAAMLSAIAGTDARAFTEREAEDHHRAAFTAMDALNVPEERKTALREFAAGLLHRAH